MLRAIFLAVCFAATPLAIAQSVTDFAAANDKAGGQADTAATRAYADSWAEFNNRHHLDERDDCYFKADGALTQILEIDKSGKVVGYFSDKDNGRSQCWRKTYLGVVFPQPPFAPYWYKMVMQ